MEGFLDALEAAGSIRSGATRSSASRASGWTRHRHLEAVAAVAARGAALAAVRVDGRARVPRVAALVVASHDDADPGHPLRDRGGLRGAAPGRDWSARRRASRRSPGRGGGSRARSPPSARAGAAPERPRWRTYAET